MTKIRWVMASLLLLSGANVYAIEVRMTAPALERTLRHQLFNQPGADGKLDRRYLKGDGSRGCSVYADQPHVFFKDDRVVVTVKTHAKLGIGRACIGISISADSEVSFVPEAEGEAVGFRDAKIEHFTNNKEMDMLLEPFLSKGLPQNMSMNAADLMRHLLVKAPDSTGYKLTLETLKLNSMQVDGQELLVDMDADFRVE